MKGPISPNSSLLTYFNNGTIAGGLVEVTVDMRDEYDNPTNDFEADLFAVRGVGSSSTFV